LYRISNSSSHPREGLILGWLSWLIAAPLSIPAGKLLVQALGATRISARESLTYE
jgi:hypothetical protein